ncbi:hypothetical protein C8P67_101236 [Flavobacterium aquicola]|uniref:Uncharacterized protein n=1 Tax=Flavobacterium aquicola TaxID=1682742 RepID=A0A3E0EVA3_9FLAO|nr:hypothetical protein C8P67_101236 [Flavobacterium aquicola]
MSKDAKDIISEKTKQSELVKKGSEIVFLR